MPEFAEPLARLVQEFKRLPGIGQKSAQRMAFSVLRSSREDAERLSQALLDVKDKLQLCHICNNISDDETCGICRDANRDHGLICVVEEPHNILPVENTRGYQGVYHVLHGAIAPLKGIGPDQLKLRGLLERIESGGVHEVILATNPNVEGEATAAYLSRLLKPLGVRVSRIGMGIPVGSDLEYADEVTMSRSLENRREL